MTLKNKWNNKTYKLVKAEDGKATLQREDGSTFVITMADYYFNYRPAGETKNNKK